MKFFNVSPKNEKDISHRLVPQSRFQSLEIESYSDPQGHESSHKPHAEAVNKVYMELDSERICLYKSPRCQPAQTFFNQAIKEIEEQDDDTVIDFSKAHKKAKENAKKFREMHREEQGF